MYKYFAFISIISINSIYFLCTRNFKLKKIKEEKEIKRDKFLKVLER